jgi:putative oxidoreductase
LDDLLLTQTNNYRQVAVLALRVALGVIFMLHGFSKFGLFGGASFQDTVDFFAAMGMPFPSITAPVLAIVEAFGGLALIFGVATRVVALMLGIVVIAEILIIKLPQSINPLGSSGYLFELSLLIGLAALSLLGPGAFALDD